MPSSSPEGFHPETLAVAYGYDPAQAMGAVKPPVYLSSTFIYPSAQHAKDVHRAFFDNEGPLAGTSNHIYARLGHPGLDILESRLAAIDLLCSGFLEIEDDENLPAPSGARRVG